jgi:hypothetical protein
LGGVIGYIFRTPYIKSAITGPKSAIGNQKLAISKLL